MTVLNTIALLITLAALFSYFNHRFIRLPTSIGIMLIGLLVSLLLIAAAKLGMGNITEQVEKILRGIDFHEALMQGMLSFLLFAGALHVNLQELAKQKWVVLLLATIGVVFSTFFVGTASWYVFNGLGLPMDYIYCLLFGALISPTDPIAVLGVLKRAGVAKSLEVKIAGESLFNDGVGVVVFLVLLGIASSGHDPSVTSVALLFMQEAVGGALFGFAIGSLAFYMLRSVDSYQVEVLITLALVMGGYAMASSLHLSGPIAMVVAGLLIGNQGRQHAMSETTREHLDNFWELLDEVLNAVLFLLIGMEVLILIYQPGYITAALIMAPLVILARYISVSGAVYSLQQFRPFSHGAIPLMTWGGIRGGISVALALSLPHGTEREIILAITYAVVVFSIAAQGLTMGQLAKKYASK